MANLRNIFAHSMHSVSFNAQEVVEDCKSFLLLGEIEKLDRHLAPIPIVGDRARFEAVFNVLYGWLRFLKGDLKFILEFADGTRTDLSSFVKNSE